MTMCAGWAVTKNNLSKCVMTCQALYSLGPNQGDVCDEHFCASFASKQAWMAHSCAPRTRHVIIGSWSVSCDVVPPESSGHRSSFSRCWHARIFTHHDEPVALHGQLSVGLRPPSGHMKHKTHAPICAHSSLKPE
jgi:hypothetical protein